MKILCIYKCLCEETRLRILNLLLRRPLCVSELQTILEEGQVKVSKHLNYMKQHGIVASCRKQNRVYYSIPDDACAELEKNLCCLSDCVQEYPIFKTDLQKMKEICSEEPQPLEKTMVEK